MIEEPYYLSEESCESLKTPPHSLLAEQSVLGALMLNNRNWDLVGDRISENDFYSKPHRIIFNAIALLAKEKKPFDVVTISDTLKLKNEQLIDIGGMSWLAYLVMLAKDTPSAANIVAYYEIVKDKAVLREALDICNNARNRIFSSEKSVDILKDFIEKSSGLLSGLEIKTGGIVHIKEVLRGAIETIDERFESDGKVTGFMETGWIDFDERWGGILEIGMTGIAGRPGMGKSTLVQNFIERFAIKEENKGKPIIIFSMDMQPEAWVLRSLSSLSKTDYKKLSTGNLENDDWTRLTAAINLLVNTDIYIDGSSLTADSFQSKVEVFTKEIGKPSIIVIDYMQQITIPAMKNQPFTVIAEVSRRLKALQKEWKCSLIVLLQLNRNLEARPNKRPIVSDIGGSNQIEQDLEAIYLLYRDEVYNNDSPDKGVAEIIGGKVREGETGTVRLVSNLAQSRFNNFSAREYSDL